MVLVKTFSHRALFGAILLLTLACFSLDSGLPKRTHAALENAIEQGLSLTDAVELVFRTAGSSVRAYSVISLDCRPPFFVLSKNIFGSHDLTTYTDPDILSRPPADRDLETENLGEDRESALATFRQRQQDLGSCTEIRVRFVREPLPFFGNPKGFDYFDVKMDESGKVQSLSPISYEEFDDE